MAIYEQQKNEENLLLACCIYYSINNNWNSCSCHYEHCSSTIDINASIIIGINYFYIFLSRSTKLNYRNLLIFCATTIAVVSCFHF